MRKADREGRDVKGRGEERDVSVLVFEIGCRLVRTRPHFHMRKSRGSEVIQITMLPRSSLSRGLALGIFLAPHGCLWGCGIDQRCGVRTIEDTVMSFVPLTTLCPYVKRQCTVVCISSRTSFQGGAALHRQKSYM